jgi:hypothetical protein
MAADSRLRLLTFFLSLLSLLSVTSAFYIPGATPIGSKNAENTQC